MQAIQITTQRQLRGESPLRRELERIYDALSDQPLIKRLWAYRWTGRRGYTPRSLWRAVIAGHYLNIRTTIGLARRLQEDAELADVCGFAALPSRITIGRFLQRLMENLELVQECMATATSAIGPLLEGFGKEWAIDSTVIGTYASPNRKVLSDGDATWSAKPNSQGKMAWHYGFKLHMIVDARYELPIYAQVLTGKVSDSVTLLPMVEAARERLNFTPSSVAADRGYDSINNVNGLLEMGVRPVILRIDRSTPQKGHGTRVRPGGEARRAIDQNAPDFRALYRRRTSVERVFSRLKEHRSLLRHSRRGLSAVSLHCLLSVLVTQASALAHAKSGDLAGVRNCARRVA